MNTINNKSHFTEVGYLRLPDVLKLFPVSKSTWWAGVKDGKFPAPVKLTERTTAWRVEDIRKLVESVDKSVTVNARSNDTKC